jgi:hypothetical protein
MSAHLELFVVERKEVICVETTDLRFDRVEEKVSHVMCGRAIASNPPAHDLTVNLTLVINLPVGEANGVVSKFEVSPTLTKVEMNEGARDRGFGWLDESCEGSREIAN